MHRRLIYIKNKFQQRKETLLILINLIQGLKDKYAEEWKAFAA